MNKCRAPKIPPLPVNNLFIFNCKEKAKYFNDFFSQQCKPIVNSSVLSILYFFTEKRIDHITVKNDEIISLIRTINPSKATGSDGISGQMLLLCDDTVILPLKIIFSNILSTSIYQDLWKIANMTHILKKADKQLIKNYRPISLLPICGKILEKIIFKHLYSYLTANRIIIKINRVIPQQINYYTLLMKSTRILIVQNALKFVQYSLTFLKHSTRCDMMD